MKIHILTTVMSLLAIYSQPYLSRAQNPTAVDSNTSKDTKIGEIGKQIPTAITFGIANGLVQYINNDRRIKVNLQWEPLPVTESLIKKSTTQEFTRIELKITNKEIESGAWITRYSTLVSELKDAFNVVDLKTLSQNLDGQKVEPIILLETGSLKVSEYMYMQQERNLVKSLLLGKGVEYSFGLKAKENTIFPPRFSDENVAWHIDIYSFKNDSGAKYYRFTAKAVVEPFEAKIPDELIEMNLKKAFYSVRFKLRKNISGMTNKLFPIKDGTVDVPEPVKEGREALNSSLKDFENSVRPLDGFLSIIGGFNQLSEVSQGLLGGTENASIIGGGLVGFQDGGVSPFIGVNQEIGKIGDDVSGGVLLGVGTGDKTSLFIGPSIRASIFTLSAGARVGAQPGSEVNFAGMVAVDLSRLTNSKTKTPRTEITLSDPGGGLGKGKDEIINKYSLIDYKSKSDIKLTRVCDENNKAIVDGNRNVVSLRPTTSFKRIYIPRGVYEYLNINKEKAYLSLNDTLLNADLTTSIGSQADANPQCD
jgi:hypothetical protein